MTSLSMTDDPTAAESMGELLSLASTFTRKMGCDYFGYLITRLPDGRTPDEDIFISNYPDEWLDRYRARSYKFYDPVVTISRRSRLPFFWGERGFLRPYRKAERHVFHEASEYRILEGYGIPAAGPEGDAGIFSVTLSNRNLVHDVVEEETARLQLFSAQFHDAAIRLAFGQERREAPELTKREKEVLSWTADGYSSEAVAARLGLTASAVNYHITNACRKLGASNKIQAVALTIRRNLI
ncbi:LuxR family transcriptional regulator [Rhizobium sp. L1K21]|uniref:LuxR family transcriptional regulator n=1 Tax=Rhizobium sp. L1K21 TaxID=2954933 RepID=UPI002091E63E|nr:LuxR family transcriptional regulator [Rhizobium sp. L1K21]MCO6185239.1 LuxR family transcriptional regulator [Rhizobium sp. L1K21]